MYYATMNNAAFFSLFLFLSAARGEPCLAQAGDLDPLRLQGRWTLVSTNGKPAASPAAFFEISGRQIRGFDGCNSFGGSLDRADLIRKTERDCPGMDPFPLDLADPLGQLNAANLEADILSLPVRGQVGIAVFRRN
ncbi:META domain-containing protein (plasmid) [Rhizobium ruizarguesonis]|uniref:META domain-containing protein n=1 Tax=Rhizobium ruizarguesonis TaxID=2081791 RepID=UPI0010324369|nr:META domain-containing protein [Rhizobium ruizarguesonis]TBC25595.1 META domain-containing protein [Rhizobium ruizarguesonis]